MKNWLFILMLLMSYNVSAQSSLISYDNCVAKKFCLDCGDSKATYTGDKSISEYFQAKTNRQILEGIKGNLYLQIIVDEVGNVCLKSISNATNASNEQIEQLQLAKVLADMKGWSPAKTKDKIEISSLTLLMNVSDAGELRVKYQRLGKISIE